MRSLKSFNLGMAFAGCFLGAGYVSGQEIWQFFGTFGIFGWVGLILALSLLAILGGSMLQISFSEGSCSSEKLVLGNSPLGLRICMIVLQLLFLFGVSSIMTAGAGALLNQLLGIDSKWGAMVFVVLLFYPSVQGIRHIIAIFSLSVPLLAIASVACFFLQKFWFESAAYTAAESFESPLIGGWITGGISFACYNLFGAIGVLSLLGSRVCDRRVICKGVAFGILFLFLIAASVLCTMTVHPEVRDAELPMLALAKGIHPILGYFYGFLLMTAMFGTALSCIISLKEHLFWNVSELKNHQEKAVFFILIAIFTASLIGFSELVGTIYPVFGYCSSFFMFILIFRVIRRQVT